MLLTSVRQVSATAACLIAWVEPAFATDGIFTMRVFDAPASMVLEVLSEIANTPLEVESDMERELDEAVYTGTFQDILADISSDIEAVVFDFNGTYYISQRSSYVTRFVWTSDLDINNTLRSISETGLSTDLFSIRQAPEQRHMILTAPPIYIALFEEIVQPLVDRRPDPEGVIQEQDRGVVIRRGVEEETIQFRSYN